jgi:2'-5' RNA ligase
MTSTRWAVLAQPVQMKAVLDEPQPKHLVAVRYPSEMEGPKVPAPPMLEPPQDEQDATAVGPEGGLQLAVLGHRADVEGPQVMVAWMLDDDDVRALLHFDEGVDGSGLSAVGADTLHVTLAYLGRLGSDVQAADVARLTARLAELAPTLAPLEGHLGGAIRFPPGEGSDGREVYAAGVDVPDLERLRAAVVDACADLGIPLQSAHGFTPHLTLGYGEPGLDADVPDALAERHPIRIAALSIVVGGERTDVALGQAAAADPVATRVATPSNAADRTIEGGLVRLARDWSRLDADPGALRGALLRSSFPTSIRKATSKEADKVRSLFTERFGGSGGGHVVALKITSSERARDGHTIDPRGWHFDEWNQNPVVLWQHMRDMLPVGRGMIADVDDDGVVALDEFVSREMDAFGGTVGDMVANGFLHSPSIGWDTLRAVRVKDPAIVERYGYPLDILEANKLEHSIVTIPADVYTGVLRARAAGMDVSAFAQRFARYADLATNPRARDSLGLIVKAAAPARSISLPTNPKENPVKTEPAKSVSVVPPQHRADAGGLRCPTCHGPVRAPSAPDPAFVNTQPPPAGKPPEGVGSRGAFDTLPDNVKAALETIAVALSGGAAGGAPAAAPPPPPGSQEAAAPPPMPPPPNGGGDKPPEPGEDEDVKAASRELFGKTETRV